MPWRRVNARKVSTRISLRWRHYFINSETEYMKIHKFELRKKEWISEWSSQLYTQLKQLRKKAWKKKSGLNGIRTHDLYDTGAVQWIFIYSLSSHLLKGYITNSHNDQLPVGLTAQLEEHCTGIAEVMGSNPVQAWIFFRLSFRNCLSCVCNCDDHSLIHFIDSVGKKKHPCHIFILFNCFTEIVFSFIFQGRSSWASWNSGNQFRRKDLVKAMHRLDTKCQEIAKALASAGSEHGYPLPSLHYSQPPMNHCFATSQTRLVAYAHF